MVIIGAYKADLITVSDNAIDQLWELAKILIQEGRLRAADERRR